MRRRGGIGQRPWRSARAAGSSRVVQLQGLMRIGRDVDLAQAAEIMRGEGGIDPIALLDRQLVARNIDAVGGMVIERTCVRFVHSRGAANIERPKCLATLT